MDETIFLRQVAAACYEFRELLKLTMPGLEDPYGVFYVSR
jgi:hypothetical protein